MKVLVISSTPWANANSFGNSYGNIFADLDELQFASIYLRPGQPDPDDRKCFFQITERSLLNNLKNPALPTGKRVIPEEGNGTERTASEQKNFDNARKLRWKVLFWARDLVWQVGRWRSEELTKFLDEFKPDLIFQPVYYAGHINDIVNFVKEYTGAPMVGYISDDCYTLRQLRFSPLYWIDRLCKRRKVKRTIEQCEILYVISQIQKEEYEKIFTPPCKVLTKLADFSGQPPVWPAEEGRLRLIYAGNIGTGRWKSLALIADAVERLQSEGMDVHLDIYSGTPRTKAMEKALDKPGSTLHKPVSYDEIQRLQAAADVMIHVEGLSLKSRLEVHQSFSTKLVDFFAMGKCILAIGTEDVASIAHLAENDAAVVAHSSEETYEKLKMLAAEPQTLADFGNRAWLCGRKHHNKETMQAALLQDLKEVVEKA